MSYFDNQLLTFEGILAVVGSAYTLCINSGCNVVVDKDKYTYCVDCCTHPKDKTEAYVKGDVTVGYWCMACGLDYNEMEEGEL